MPDSKATSQAAEMTEVVLSGGPQDIPVEARTLRLNLANRNPDEKIKIRHGNGYEHFERSPDSGTQDGSGPVVFRWTRRTRIAE
ncbi:DUF5988 family protein [Streptomyces sp. NPDC018693]|uniref:DUF5988 family protein n=1 Tax=unclassified Streptomyces TaxID=2593676 RepID=UPI00379A2017